MSSWTNVNKPTGQNWTGVNKPAGTNWSGVPKPTPSSILTSSGGEPIGLLLALTKSLTISSIISDWTDISKPINAVWTNVSKPTTPNWTSIAKPIP